MLLIGVGMVLIGLGTVNYPHIFRPTLILVVGMVVVERGWTLWRRVDTADSVDGVDMGMGMDPGMMGMGSPFDMIDGDYPPDVQRLLQVARATWPDELDLIHHEMDGDVLTSYTFQARTAGFFTDGGVKTRVANKLTNAVPPSRGGWTPTFDTKKDTITVSQKSSIPNIALPPEWHVVTTAKEAQTAYKKFAMTLGPGEGGEMVTFKPQVFPHVAVIATAGGGKSVFLRACIEQMRALGGQILLGDGKGVDYSTLRNQPGVVAIGRGSGAKGVEYLAAVEIAFRIMQHRQNTAAERKAANPDGWEDLPPVFLILDELKSVLKKWSTELDKKSYKSMESKVNQIFALGRQLRVHVYCASQDVYAESIPPSWLTNIGMKISLGKPHHLTINKGFDESIREDALRIANGIDPNVRGRGMIAGMDEDSGTAAVKSYQGFLGYSPGEALPGFLNTEQKEKWNSFRKNVSEAIPHLYSRKWFRIDEKPEAQVKQESATGQDLGYIDFELFSLDEISMLPIINLDKRDANGNIVPDPAMKKYDPDPTNDEYVCKPVVSAANTVTEI